MLSFAIFFANPMEGLMNLDPTAWQAIIGFGSILAITIGLLVWMITRKMRK